jgi:crotonobetainyl-CoA:carnitine CoA-transferase CaiB-like acyl-CoA transferase
MATSHLWTGETFRAPALPFEVDGTMLTGGGDVDAIGAHSAEILGALGMSEADIADAMGIAA